jgi:ASC-1-like (ASCH) protein
MKSFSANTETQKILKELPGKTITPEMLPLILDALRSKTVGDDVIPSFIEDIQVGDTVKFSKDKKSVTIKSVQNIPKFIIVFQQEDLRRPDVLSQKPFGKGESL